MMATVIKLQRIGNSLRATIPKEVADALALKQGEQLVVDIKDDAVLLTKKGSHGVAELYGTLQEKTGEVRHWPTPREIKSIWE